MIGISGFRHVVCPYAWLVLVAAAALPILPLVFVYNRLAVLSHRCERALADIDVQVRHRAAAVQVTPDDFPDRFNPMRVAKEVA